MSILPNILDVTRQYNINIYPSQTGRVERRGDCPFCGGKGSFQLNTAKNVFLCNRQNHCGVRGGVLDLLVLLTGKSRNQLIAELKNPEVVREYVRAKQIHPAISISHDILKEMKFHIFNPDWYERTMKDWADRLEKYPTRTKEELDFIWFMYQRHLKNKERRLEELLDQINSLIIKEKLEKLLLA